MHEGGARLPDESDERHEKKHDNARTSTDHNQQLDNRPQRAAGEICASTNNQPRFSFPTALSNAPLSLSLSLTLTCLVFSTRPWPEQVPQYSSTTTPAPRQVGQVVCVWKAPSGVRVAWMTTPEPPHWPQVLDFAPGLTPLPEQVVQPSKWRMRTWGGKP